MIVTNQGFRYISADYSCGDTTAVATYYVKDLQGCIWFTGTFKECENYINQIK